MVLNKVNDVVVEFSHVGEFRHEHGVTPSKPLVVLGESRDGAGDAAAAAAAEVTQ